MTKKQREEYERQKQSELRKAGKIPPEKSSSSTLSPVKKSMHASIKSSEKKNSHVNDSKYNPSSNMQNGAFNKSHSSNGLSSMSSKTDKSKISNGSLSR